MARWAFPRRSLSPRDSHARFGAAQGTRRMQHHQDAEMRGWWYIGSNVVIGADGPACEACEKVEKGG
jgi:hypothetical protein